MVLLLLLLTLRLGKYSLWNYACGHFSIGKYISKALATSLQRIGIIRHLRLYLFHAHLATN